MSRLEPLCPATSEAGARWPISGLVVVATTSCRDNKIQMIRPLVQMQTNMWHWGQSVLKNSLAASYKDLNPFSVNVFNGLCRTEKLE
jgi:hypothetical protein